jgi:hypothetical protein
MEPFKRKFWTGVRKSIEDEVARRKSGAERWKKMFCLREKAGKKPKVWQKKIELDGDVSLKPFAQVGKKVNQSRYTPWRRLGVEEI